MIYTVTFNPAIDCLMTTPKLDMDAINRASDQQFFFGGKGVNVSYILKRLGQDTCAWGYIAGWTGKALEEALQKDGIETDFIHLSQGQTRLNAKISIENEQGGIIDETALNAPGPEVSKEALQALFDKIAHLQHGDMVIISGALTKNLPESTYADLAKLLHEKDIPFVIDATKKALTSTLPYKPFLVKPNDEELAEICGCDPNNVDELMCAAQDLQKQGAQNVLVSRGGKGSIFLDSSKEIHQASAIKGTMISSVGAGDSTIGGFVAGYVQSIEKGASIKESLKHAYKLAQASGSATAFSPGLAEGELISELYKSL